MLTEQCTMLTEQCTEYDIESPADMLAREYVDLCEEIRQFNHHMRLMKKDLKRLQRKRDAKHKLLCRARKLDLDILRNKAKVV